MCGVPMRPLALLDVLMRPLGVLLIVAMASAAFEMLVNFLWAVIQLGCYTCAKLIQTQNAPANMFELKRLTSHVYTTERQFYICKGFL